MATGNSKSKDELEFDEMIRIHEIREALRRAHRRPRVLEYLRESRANYENDVNHKRDQELQKQKEKEESEAKFQTKLAEMKALIARLGCDEGEETNKEEDEDFEMTEEDIAKIMDEEWL